MSGSSKQTIGYKYYLGAHMVFSHGPIDAVRRIRVDERIAWTSDDTDNPATGGVDGQISINKPELFGGESREGGVVATVDIEMGAATQLQNTYLESQLIDGVEITEIPAYRGVTGLVLNQAYIGNNPYLKTWDIRATRILTGWDGNDIWYPAKAPIDTCVLEEDDKNLLVTNFDDFLITDLSCDSLGDADIADESSVTEEDGSFLLTTTSDANGSLQWVRWENDGRWTDLKTATFELIFEFVERDWPISDNFGVSLAGVNNNYSQIEDRLSLHLAGTSSGVFLTQLKDGGASYTIGQVFPGEINHVAYVWDASLDKPRIYFNGNFVQVANGTTRLRIGRPVYMGGKMDFASTTEGFYKVRYHGIRMTNEVEYEGTGTYEVPERFDIPICLTQCHDMNPAHIIRECLIAQPWGMGYNTGDIDDTAFTAAADALHTEGFGLSLLWGQQTQIDEFIEMVLSHIDASLYVSRDTGKFVLKLTRDDYTVGSLLELDPDSIVSIHNFKRKTIAELTNQVTVVFWDCSTGKDSSVTVNDIALIQQQGAVIGTTMQYPGITCRDLASKVAGRDLRALSTPTASCTLVCNRVPSNLNVGDVFKLTWSRYGLSEAIMRVTNIELGNVEKNQIKIDCTEDVFALASAIYTPSGTSWTEPTSFDPEASANTLAIESPYYEIARGLGDTNAQQLDDTAGFIAATCSRPSSLYFNALLYVDGNTDSTGTAAICPVALANEDVRREGGPSTFEITGGIDLDNVETGTYVPWDDEIVRIDTISSSSVTVSRGCLDTHPQAHTTGSVLFFADGYVGSDEVEYADSESVSVKVAPVAPRGHVGLGSITADNITFYSRLGRPYPPANIELNSQYFPSAIPTGTDLVVTWAHRDRLQQTAGVNGWTEGDIGPEAGTTYSIELYLDGSPLTLIDSDTGITGTTHTFTNATMGANIGDLILKLWSVRDSLDSYQIFEYTFLRDDYEEYTLAGSPGEAYGTADSPSEDYHVFV